MCRVLQAHGVYDVNAEWAREWSCTSHSLFQTGFTYILFDWSDSLLASSGVKAGRLYSFFSPACKAQLWPFLIMLRAPGCSALPRRRAAAGRSLKTLSRS